MLRMMTTSLAPAAHRYAVRARHQHRSHLAAAAVERDRLGDGQRAKTARIERIDFAARRGLGDGARQVLHGAVRLHGLASSPTPETQVRVAWALSRRTGQDGRDDAERGEQQISSTWRCLPSVSGIRTMIGSVSADTRRTYDDGNGIVAPSVKNGVSPSLSIALELTRPVKRPQHARRRLPRTPRRAPRHGAPFSVSVAATTTLRGSATGTRMELNGFRRY